MLVDSDCFCICMSDLMENSDSVSNRGHHEVDCYNNDALCLQGSDQMGAQIVNLKLTGPNF